MMIKERALGNKRCLAADNHLRESIDLNPDINRKSILSGPSETGSSAGREFEGLPRILPR
jgi:hypothetical protein